MPLKLHYSQKETPKLIGLFSWNLAITNFMQCFLYGPISCNWIPNQLVMAFLFGCSVVHVMPLYTDILKETKTHISSYFNSKVFIIENNQWKFEQNQAKNKEVTALWYLANSRGRYSKWWQVVDNSPYVLYMKFHVFPLFWWLRQFHSLNSRYDKQGCILHDILWGQPMKTHVSKENLKIMKFCVQNEWRVVHNCPHNLITALYCSLDLKML